MASELCHSESINLTFFEGLFDTLEHISKLKTPIKNTPDLKIVLQEKDSKYYHKNHVTIVSKTVIIFLQQLYTENQDCYL